MASPTPTIFIVDDDESMRLSLAGLMRSAGYVATTFASIEDFITSGDLCEPACVISDERMPDGSGHELPSKLRELGTVLPVIIVTAHDNTELRDQAKRAGVSNYLRKPVDDQALFDAIEWALG